MSRYSEELKYSIITKIMPPQNQSITEIARKTGLPEVTLYKWEKQAEARGIAVPA